MNDFPFKVGDKIWDSNLTPIPDNVLEVLCIGKDRFFAHDGLGRECSFAIKGHPWKPYVDLPFPIRAIHLYPSGSTVSTSPGEWPLDSASKQAVILMSDGRWELHDTERVKP